MTPDALNMLFSLCSMKNMFFVPVTTRSTEQYERICFREGFTPPAALAANGGILYENGKIVPEWFRESKEIISDCMDEFEKCIEYFKDDEYVYFDIRIVDELFVFTKSTAPLTTRAVLESVADLSKVSVFSIGDKVYVFPNKLTKGNALKRLASRYSFDRIFCAGDSEFDIPMLNEADLAFCPEPLRRYIITEKCVFFDSMKRNFAEQMLEYILKNNQ